MCSALSSRRLLQDHFRAISGLPCWDVRCGYGSFVTFNFGQPHLDVREPSPKSKSSHFHRRRVTVCGDRELWFEQCEWRITEREVEIAESESFRATMSVAFARLDGQYLKEIHIDPGNGVCRFRFELDMSFDTRRYSDFESDDPMWHLYSPDSVITYIASGRIEYGAGYEAKPDSIDCDEIRLAL